MHPILAKTFGGLSAQYYFRQFMFGFAFAALIFYLSTNKLQSIQTDLTLILVANALLYPYSRFVYEGIVRFIMGDNVFYVNAILMLVVKYITMGLCFSFAIIIAPIGLVYLYFYHSKQERKQSAQEN